MTETTQTESDDATEDDTAEPPASYIAHVPPEHVTVDEMNERESDIETADLEDSIEEVGIVQPPLVRDLHPEEGDDGVPEYAAVVGQRRVLAAQNVGLDEIPVIVMGWSDEEALEASITENIDVFSQDVSMSDRAQALQQMWEMMGGSGMPVQSHLGAKLGVPRETVRQWLEPLHDGWKDTTLDPSTDEDPDPAIEELGERKLIEIRRMTDSPEEAEEVAELVADAGLTQEEVKEMRSLVEDEDYSYEAAIDALTSDDEESTSDAESTSDGAIEANVKFGSETSTAVSEYADDHDQKPATVIVDAVQWFLESEGYLDD